VGTAIINDDIAAGAEVGAAAGAEVQQERQDGTDLWRDGRRLVERGAILHLLPPLMTSDERLLTLLLMKFALGGRPVEVKPMKLRLIRTIKRWVASDYVLDSPIPPPIFVHAVLIQLTC
jgi:hypothetical protein